MFHLSQHKATLNDHTAASEQTLIEAPKNRQPKLKLDPEGTAARSEKLHGQDNPRPYCFLDFAPSKFAAVNTNL